MNYPNDSKGISVIMPTYNQAAFISKSIASLRNQLNILWELIIVNDGSTDNTKSVVDKFIDDERIKYYEFKENKGLGAALNAGLEKSSYKLISYLPSDDIIYNNHLSSLYKELISDDTAILSFSGIIHHSNQLIHESYEQYSSGIIKGYPLQLVQVLHYKTNDKWTEREELVTDDLNVMFWHKLLKKGDAICTEIISCEWVDHPYQRHKMINERKGGGIFRYKQYYNVKYPIRFQSSLGNFIDEITFYKPFRNPLILNDNGLRILLVGDLSYNPERIYALEESGHKLFGVWTTFVNNITTVGPLPFGNVTDISLLNWKSTISEIKPDIIYGLLNWHSVELAHDILINKGDIPFVWHFKEGPMHCMHNGLWNQLVELYTKSDGVIFHNSLAQQWYRQFLVENNQLSYVLDGELPKLDWFTHEQSPLLSEKDGHIHTVIVGRPVGITKQILEELAFYKVHVHLYGEVFHVAYKGLIEQLSNNATNFFHLHPHCTPDNWVKEFSQYDAGWLHIFDSKNNGELFRLSWDDLNSPARISTYVMAGLPILQKNNIKHLVATQILAKTLDIGINFKSISELVEQLLDKENTKNIRSNVWRQRHLFCFDYHVNDIINFFIECIDKRKAYATHNKF
jgi:glycosyltransferase involved in cell wall biosynthesis